MIAPFELHQCDLKQSCLVEVLWCFRRFAWNPECVASRASVLANVLELTMSVAVLLKEAGLSLVAAAFIVFVLFTDKEPDDGAKLNVTYATLESLVVSGQIERVVVREHEAVAIMKHPTTLGWQGAKTRIVAAGFSSGGDADFLRLIEAHGFQVAPRLQDLPWR